MKFSLVAVIVSAFVGVQAIAQEVEKIVSLPEAQSKIPAHIVSSVVKVESQTSSNTDLRLVITDHGLTTDVSPRFQVFLVYYHAGEMNNTFTTFEIGRFVTVKFVKWKKPVSGYYALQVMQPDFKPYYLYIDARKVFADDKALKLEEMEDKYFDSEITVTTK